MKFGIRECANIVFRAKQKTQIGKYTFQHGQPVLYIDTATTSTVEQATATTYAQGGRGNTRLIAWEGDKTLTFTVTDALISPISLAMLSGAGLIKKGGTDDLVHVHANTRATIDSTGKIDLTDALRAFGPITGANQVLVDAGVDAPIYIIVTERDGSLTGDLITGAMEFAYDQATGKGILTVTSPKINGTGSLPVGGVNVMVDYYVKKKAANVSEIQVTPSDFAGYYYVEADTLFRAQDGGIDMPANLTFPNVKIQSGFSIAMSGTGDPSTFDFTMDAFPGYTYFNKTKQVLCVIQVVEDSEAATVEGDTVMPVNSAPEEPEAQADDSATS